MLQCPALRCRVFSARFREGTAEIEMLIFVLSLKPQTSQIYVSRVVDEDDRLGGQGGRPSIDVRIFKPLLDTRRTRW